jgi:hypothetical protein
MPLPLILHFEQAENSVASVRADAHLRLDIAISQKDTGDMPN